jgi:hypothetical protein
MPILLRHGAPQALNLGRKRHRAVAWSTLVDLISTQSSPSPRNDQAQAGLLHGQNLTRARGFVNKIAWICPQTKGIHPL